MKISVETGWLIFYIAVFFAANFIVPISDTYNACAQYEYPPSQVKMVAAILRGLSGALLSLLALLNSAKAKADEARRLRNGGGK